MAETDTTSAQDLASVNTIEPVTEDQPASTSIVSVTTTPQPPARVSNHLDAEMAEAAVRSLQSVHNHA